MRLATTVPGARTCSSPAAPYGAPRPSLDGWLNSPGHRENLFRPEWRTQGIAVEKVERFGQDRNMTLWVNQFGDG